MPLAVTHPYGVAGVSLEPFMPQQLPSLGGLRSMRSTGPRLL